MAGAYFDLTAIGFKRVQRIMKELELKNQKKAVKPALGKSAYRLRQFIVQNIERVLKKRTGNYIRAWKKAKVRDATKNPRQFIRRGLVWPTRAEFGIDPDDPNFYPVAIEYGHQVRGKGQAQTKRERTAWQKMSQESRWMTGAEMIEAKPHVRPAVDDNYTPETRRIGYDIALAIREMWKLHRAGKL